MLPPQRTALTGQLWLQRHVAYKQYNLAALAALFTAFVGHIDGDNYSDDCWGVIVIIDSEDITSICEPNTAKQRKRVL